MALIFSTSVGNQQCVCVCVCDICKNVTLQLLAGGSGPLVGSGLMSGEDIGTDHPDVPATFFAEWEEAQPKNLHTDWFVSIMSSLFDGLPVWLSQSEFRHFTGPLFS